MNVVGHRFLSNLHAFIDGTAFHTCTAFVDTIRWPLALPSGPLANAHARRHVRHVRPREGIQLANATVQAEVDARIVVANVHFAVLATVLVGTVADWFSANLHAVTGVAADEVFARSRYSWT